MLLEGGKPPTSGSVVRVLLQREEKCSPWVSMIEVALDWDLRGSLFETAWTGPKEEEDDVGGSSSSSDGSTRLQYG